MTRHADALGRAPCSACGTSPPATDRLAFGDRVACFSCLVKATLTGRIGSKVLVMVKRTGPKFEQRSRP